MNGMRGGGDHMVVGFTTTYNNKNVDIKFSVHDAFLE
jgi:hypothetical protein